MNKISMKKAAPAKILVPLLVLVLAAGGSGYYLQKKNISAAAAAAAVKTGLVTRKNITSTLNASGTISPKDTYTITSMVDGEVIESFFEEGDTVEKGQVLYQIDTTSVQSKLSSAEHSLTRAQNKYDDAASELAKAQSKYSGNTYKSTRSGYIKELYVQEGDRVSNNTQLADIYDDSVMVIRVPFLNIEAAQVGAGSIAVLTMADTLEQVQGTVTAVSQMDEALSGGRVVRYITVEVANPGGLMPELSATVEVNGFRSVEDGNFSAKVQTVLAADLSSSVEIESVLVHEGDRVEKGTPVFKMTADTAKKLLDGYTDSVDSAEFSLENARSSLDSTQDNFNNYTITAPIAGRVVTKNTKVGDKLQNGNSATQMAVIYDMSTVTFQMNIDELDILSVKVGQKVNITADAFEGTAFTGKVTNVSMEGSSSNGVTYYPVTVTLDDYGNLLPGMNVEGEIVSGDLEENTVVYVAQSTVSTQNNNAMNMGGMPGVMGGMPGGMGGAPGAGGGQGGGNGGSGGGRP